MGPARRGLREGGVGRREEALTEEAAAWGRRRGCARAPALLLSFRRRHAARARRQREAAEVPVPAGAGGRLVPGAHARPSPGAPADSCSWAPALGGLGPSALRPLGLPPLHLHRSCPRCGSFRNCSPLARCLAAFPFPGPFCLSTLPPTLHLGRGAPEGTSGAARGGSEAPQQEETRRAVGRRPHATLSGHLPSRPAPAHTPWRASYFRTRKVRAALGDSAAGPVPGKPRVCSRLVRRAPKPGHSRDRGWLRPPPAPGSRTSISFSRSSERGHSRW